MFRRSLRSISGPVRSHVCYSCLLARRIENPFRGLQFYATAPFESEQSAELESPPKPHVSISLAGGDPETTPAPEENGSPDDQPSGGSPIEGNTNDAEELQNEGPNRPAKRPKKERKPREKEAIDPKEKKTIRVRKVPVSSRRRASPRKEVTPSKEATTTPRKKKAIFADDEEETKLAHLSKYVKEKHSGFVRSDEVTITPLDIETTTVPHLSFGLDRVLFNPGVYHLRDPRSRVYNFDPYLGSIMPVTEFDFDALKQYITSSKDEMLLKLAVKKGKRYVGSSSSMTSVLSHFHYLLSAWRAINTDTLSQGFPDKLRTFTRLLRAPAAMFLHYKDGVYAIDADKEFDSANILMNLGKSMEKLLTLPKEEFERYRRSSSNKITPEEENAIPESYHYSTTGDFVMRSQLDAHDPRLPGTGMFDLKTRAVVSIRMDAQNFEHGLGYEIKHRFGGTESYEREYYDMIRAAFLKYSLQVRVGRMDGIFVAFHNIERIFGFQYFSLPEMDRTIHGQSDTTLGDKEFQLSLELWNNILNKATAKFPQKSLRFHFETRDAQTPFMYIFAEPVTDEEIEAIQTKNKAEIDEFQRRILNLGPKPGEGSPTELPPPDDLEEVDHNDAFVAAEATTTTTITSQLPAETPPESSSPSEEGQEEEQQQQQQPEEQKQEKQEPSRDIFAMLLSISSTVNGRPVIRPTNLTAEDKWVVEYELSEIQGPQIWNYYEACQKRREKALAGRGEDETDVANNAYLRRLREVSQKGREWRKEQDRLDAERGIVVLGEPNSSQT